MEIFSAAPGASTRQQPVVAAIGDSITANATYYNTSLISAYAVNGFMTWWRILSGQRFNFPIGHNLAVAGTSLATIAASAANVAALSPRPQYCVVMGGTNDLSTTTDGASFASLQTSMLTALNTLLSANIQPIVLPILPRTGLTTNSLRTQMRFNTWLRELCWGRSDLTTATSGKLPIFVDPTEYLIDATTGAMQNAYTADNVHPSIAGAYYIGKAINDVMSAIMPPSPTKTLAVGDIYDATYNPSGSVLSASGVNRGMMTGTGGTLTTSASVTPTGSVANTWFLFRGTGTSTATLVGAKESPRTDITNSNGERQQVTATITAAGASDEYYRLQNSGLNVSPGDSIFAEVAFEVLAGGSNLRTPQLQIFEGGSGAAGSTPRKAIDGYYPSGNPTFQTLPNIGFSGTLRTPPITLQAGANQFTIQMEAVMKGDVTGSSSIKWGDCAVRKVA